MSEFQAYFYDEQIRKYLVQFMAIFAGMYVSVGKTGDLEPRLIKVPIKNGSSDRIVADIKNSQTQNKPIRLPIMSATITNLVLAPNLRKGVAQSRRTTSMPTGGEFPTDIRVTEQYLSLIHI